ncbi:hypothetical protein ACU42Y_13070 [Proteus mirabilis]
MMAASNLSESHQCGENNIEKDKYNFSFNGFFWGILPVKKKRLILVKQRICQKLILHTKECGML